MALEALKRYAEEQNQATQTEVNKLLENGAQKGPVNDEKKQGNVKPLVNKENVTEALQGRIADLYKEQAERSRISEQLRIKIYKAVNNGENHTDILLMALECISLMTGDRVFYEQNKRTLNEKQKLKGFDNEI